MPAQWNLKIKDVEMNEMDIENAKKALLDFMEKMNSWEINAYSLYKQENGGVEKNSEFTRNSLEEIYKLFLTQRERKTGRLANLHASQFPEYDINLESIESYECMKNKVVLYTNKIDANIKDYITKNKYTLIKKGDSFLLDKKERYSPSNGKWVATHF